MFGPSVNINDFKYSPLIIGVVMYITCMISCVLMLATKVYTVTSQLRGGVTWHLAGTRNSQARVVSSRQIGLWTETWRKDHVHRQQEKRRRGGGLSWTACMTSRWWRSERARAVSHVITMYLNTYHVNGRSFNTSQNVLF